MGETLPSANHLVLFPFQHYDIAEGRFMDDRRFDSLARSLANGASRRSVLKGILGLGGAAVAGGTLLDGKTEAARRPTPTPKPVRCPGNQTPVGGVCTCPDTAPYECGPACCTGEAGDPPSPTHTECCDNACCHGTCYGEELCCPTNPGPGEQPPTHQICSSAQGVECCPADQDCCEVDGCCETVCWGGEDGNSNCCSPGAFCPGNDSPDLCCTNNFICCGAGTSGNLCRDPNVANGCCTTEDCPSGQVCESNVCVTPCELATVHIFAQTHGPLESQYVCPGPFQNVVTEIGLYSSGDGACGEIAIATASTSADGPAVFENIPAGQYCALPTEQSLVTCLDCPDYGVGVGVDLTVPCGGLFQWTIGIDSCCAGVGSGCPCQPGTYDNSEGSCVPCAPGTYSDIQDALECANCDLNSYQDQSGQTACISCPDGTYTEHVGSSSAEQCLACDCQAGGMPDVCGCPVICDIGYAPNESGICEICPTGTYSFNSPECIPCAAGTFNSLPGNYRCIDCAPGTFAAEPGATECTSCDPGTVNDDFGNDTCSACPVGTYADAPGSRECSPCHVGTYNDTTGQGTCTPCPVGYHSVTEGTTECAPCAAGTFTNVPGAFLCINCPPGSYAESGASACTPCAAGTYANHVAASECLVCDCGDTCNPVSGSCAGAGNVGVGGACTQNGDCASNICGCGSPSGLPECMCRFPECWGENVECSTGHGAISCCEGDCLCTGAGCFCTAPS
jgi:hypothetical protein